MEEENKNLETEEPTEVLGNTGVIEPVVEEPVVETPTEPVTPTPPVEETPVVEAAPVPETPVEQPPAEPAPVAPAPEEPKKEEKKGSNKLLIIVALLVLVLGGGYAVWAYVLGGNTPKTEPKKEEEQKEEKKEEEKQPEEEKGEEQEKEPEEPAEVEVEVEEQETKEKIETLVNKLFDPSFTDQKRTKLFQLLKEGKKGLTVPEKLYLTFYINEIKFETVTNKEEVISEYHQYVDEGAIKRVKQEIVHENYKKLFNEDYSPSNEEENQKNFIEGVTCPRYIYGNDNTKEYYFINTCGGGAISGFGGKYTSNIEKVTKTDNNYYAYVKLTYTNEGQEDKITNIKFVFDKNIVFVETIVEKGE